MAIDNISFKEWIIALKSGEYYQATSTLCSLDDLVDYAPRHCCIGVYGSLCGIRNSVMARPHYSYITDLGDAFHIRSDVAEFLVKEVAPEEAPVDHSDIVKLGEILAYYNDAGYSFEQIADLLIFHCWLNGIEQ